MDTFPLVSVNALRDFLMALSLDCWFGDEDLGTVSHVALWPVPPGMAANLLGFSCVLCSFNLPVCLFML